MANINFISARRAERVRLKKWSRGLSYAIVAAGAVVGMLLLFTFAEIYTTQGKIKQAQTELQGLQAQIRQVQADEAERAKLQPMILTLTKAQTDTQFWMTVMDTLKRCVPQQTWLTNVQAEKYGDAPGQLRISGVTTDAARVGETMLRLNQRSDTYSTVNLNFARTSLVNEQRKLPSVEFELMAPLQATKIDAAQGGTNGETR
jgi:Tfp pilus assembly protein PilN